MSENTQHSAAAKIFWGFFFLSDSCSESARVVNYLSLIILLFSKFQLHCLESKMQPRFFKDVQKQSSIQLQGSARQAVTNWEFA